MVRNVKNEGIVFGEVSFAHSKMVEKWQSGTSKLSIDEQIDGSFSVMLPLSIIV